MHINIILPFGIIDDPDSITVIPFFRIFSVPALLGKHLRYHLLRQKLVFKKTFPKLQYIFHSYECTTVTCAFCTDRVNVRTVIIRIRTIDITVCTFWGELVKRKVSRTAHAASVENILLKINIKIHTGNLFDDRREQYIPGIIVLKLRSSAVHHRLIYKQGQHIFVMSDPVIGIIVPQCLIIIHDRFNKIIRNTGCVIQKLSDRNIRIYLFQIKIQDHADSIFES